MYGKSNISMHGKSNINMYGTRNINMYDTSNINTYGTSNINMHGTSNINKHGTSNINTHGTSNINTHGTSNINMYGTSNINVYGTSNINIYGTSNIKLGRSRFSHDKDNNDHGYQVQNQILRMRMNSEASVNLQQKPAVFLNVWDNSQCQLMLCSLPPARPPTLLSPLHADELPHNFIMINTMTFQSRPQYKANDAARGL